MPTLLRLLIRLFRPPKRLPTALEDREFQAVLLELEPEMKFIRKRLTLANYLLVEGLMEFAFIYGQTGSLDKARNWLKLSTGKPKGKR